MCPHTKYDVQSLVTLVVVGQIAGEHKKILGFFFHTELTY